LTYVIIEKDSPITIRFKKNNPKNSSKFNIPRPARIAAINAYLFLLKNPVKIMQNVNAAEKIEDKIKLYSSSKMDTLGPHTAFNQKE
jgi:hypothetical protein